MQEQDPVKEKKQMFLVSFLVNVIRKRTGVPDQIRLRGVVVAKDIDHARERFAPMAHALGFTFDLEPIEMIDLDNMVDFPHTLRNRCRQLEFDLAVSVLPAGVVPSCS